VDHPPPAGDLGLETLQVSRLGDRVQRGEADRAGLALGDLHPGQMRQLLVEQPQLPAHVALQLGDEHGRIERLTQAGVVLDPVLVEVGRQVLLRVAPLVGHGHPDLLAAQPIPQRAEDADLVDGAQDPLPATVVNPVQQLAPGLEHHLVDRHVLAERVVALDPPDMATEQGDGVDDRPVGGVG
jgi:hypothetical protein